MGDGGKVPVRSTYFIGHNQDDGIDTSSFFIFFIFFLISGAEEMAIYRRNCRLAFSFFLFLASV